MATITLDVRLLDVDGRDIHDPSVTIRLEASSSPVAARTVLDVRGAPVLARVAAPADTALKVRISPSRYRDGGRVGLVSNERLTLPALTLPRDPSHWLPSFASWAALPAEMDSTKALLVKSKRFQLGRGSTAGEISEARYDAVDAADESRAMAKMSLLNLGSRLRQEPIPGGAGTWMDAIDECLLAQRDRCFARVGRTFFERVQQLASNSAGGYKRSNAENHRGRIAEVPGVEHVGAMFSIKSGEAKANIQLTVAEVTLRGGAAFLLDADIDEQGTLLGHTFEVIRNFISDHETHPIDIHESLRKAFATAPIGFLLEPLRPAAEVTARVVEARIAGARSLGAAPMALVPSGAFTPATIAVLGDSVPWGQGLLRAHKMHELVADAYGAQGPRPATTLVAHSGAVIGVGMASTGAVCDGEVPKGRPTILQQVAAFDASEARSTDLVIINGGINDVDVRVIVSPFTSPTTLADRTARACGDDLTALLRAALAKFPKARIAVLTYYPILSPLSRFGEGLQFVTALGAPPPLALAPAAAPSLSLWDNTVANCRVFHEASTVAIRRAVMAANSGPGAGRCVVVDPGFTDEHAALAPEARLFGINWDFSPQDPVAHQRRQACDRCEKDVIRREQCYRASAGHPNPIGAEAYAQAIVAAVGTAATETAARGGAAKKSATRKRVSTGPSRRRR